MNNLAIKQTGSNQSFVKVENMDKPATKRQLWALFAASKKHGEKHDYRNDNLTMKQASELLQQFNSKQVVNTTPTQKKAVKTKKNTLEQEFIDYMTKHFDEVIAVGKQACNMESVVTDDPLFTPENKRRSWAFVGFGCGISIIQFDKRSKVGKQIVELARKHRFTTFQKMFLNAFTTEQKNYLKAIGCPLEAIYAQDVRIGSYFQGTVREFMELKGVKRTWVQTFDD